MKKIFFLFFIINATYAAQSIQIHAQLPDNSPTAELLFIVDDSDTGRKTPASMSLRAGQNLQTFQVAGDHYQLIPVKLQGPNIQFTPCVPTQVISNHSLIVTITGTIAPNQLACAYRETTTLPQLYTPIAKPSAPITPTAVADPNAGKKVIADYLTALSKNCQKGKFIADFDSQSVTYNILGMNAGHCNVTVGTNQLPPLTCSFNQNDIALLASPTEIESYKMGTAEYSDTSLSARIMKARCKAETPKK